MNIILTLLNFSTNKFLFTEGATLSEAIMPWLKDENSKISDSVDILDIMSGTGFNKESLEYLGIEDRNVLAFDIRKLFNKAAANFQPLYLDEDWVMDFPNASEFKFSPYCYSFKSGSRRFYVLNLNGMNMILSNYRGNWNIVPLKYPGDMISNYVPVNKN